MKIKLGLWQLKEDNENKKNVFWIVLFFSPIPFILIYTRSKKLHPVEQMEEEKISIPISEPTNKKLWHANLGIF